MLPVWYSSQCPAIHTINAAVSVMKLTQLKPMLAAAMAEKT